MDASSSETEELFQPVTMQDLLAELLAWMESVPGVYSLTMNVDPLLPTKTALVSTQNKTQLLMRLAQTLGVPLSMLQDDNVTCAES
jgi:hypothetical protein